MNRIIKFRGLSVNEFWFYGLLSISEGKGNQPAPGHYISNLAGMPWACQVRPETVGQFTNLLDAKKIEIFEGDIVTHFNRLFEVTFNFNGYYLQKYKLWRGKFVPSQQYCMSLFTKPRKDRLGGEVESAEIIGNIHQHPHLLKQNQ